MKKLEDSKLILIAEDSDDDYEATLRAFNQSGNMKNPLKRCENGQAVLDYLDKHGKDIKSNKKRPGLILLDLNMPGLDGRETLSRIKSNKEVKDIPVIVLTTSDDTKDIEECYKAGANTYIQKPVDLDGFLKAIQKLQQYWFEIAILPKSD